ncbi:MAG: hypothetical protein Q4G10_03315 [Bacteroidia bacterium]|nr:hypothetical protein [Bacteroidia bacterium]
MTKSSLLPVVVFAVLLTACAGGPSRIVSDQPVDNAILGATLCCPVSEAAVLRAFDQAGMGDISAEHYHYGSISGLRAVPSSDDGILFAGCFWDYVDYEKDASDDLFAIVFENSYKTKAQAMSQYKKVAGLMETKHGESNISKSKGSCTSMWTDNTNSVGVSVHKDKPRNPRGKWTCTFYYVNINLYQSL